MNRPQCSGTLNAQTTQCTQSALCDATADASGSRSDGVQRAWETDGCDVVPLRGLQRQCARAVDAWIWCKRSNTIVRDWLWALQPMLRRPKYLPHRTRRSAVAKIPKSSDHDVKRGAGNGSRRRRGAYDMPGAPAAPAGRLHGRFASRFSWLLWPGHDSGRPIRPRVARNAGFRYTAVRRRNGRLRPRRRCSRQRPG